MAAGVSIDRRRCLAVLAASVAFTPVLTPMAWAQALSPELSPWAAVLQRWRKDQLLLLGEVHDNVGQHRSRLALLTHLTQQGWRPALLMEQLDRSQQATIDEARKRPGADAKSLLEAVTGSKAPSASNWDWPSYLPFIDLALRHGLPLIAANVPRPEARLVMNEGLRSHGFDEAIPADIREAHQREILASHCGAIPASVADRMVLAQVARDQFMARMLTLHGAQGAVLLAGNGHVRKDVGVPRWLTPDASPRALSVGLLEEGDKQREAYDLVLVTPVQPRPDPCAEFAQATSKPPAASQASPAAQPAASSRP